MIGRRWGRTERGQSRVDFFSMGIVVIIVHDRVDAGVSIGARAPLYHVPGANCEGLRYFSYPQLVATAKGSEMTGASPAFTLAT